MKNKSKSRQRPLRAILLIAPVVVAALILFWFVVRGTIHEIISVPTPTLISNAFTPTMISPVTANAQWKPQLKSFDNVAMMLVPPGCFMMGITGTDIATLDRRPPIFTTPLLRFYLESGPQYQMCFDKPFWIDKDLVTNAQFAQFNGKAALPTSVGSQNSAENRPRDSITWFEAAAFCTLRGARLPTEAEWEYAARGPDNLIYPWGNTIPDNQPAYFGMFGIGAGPSPVESNPVDLSWVGAFDMVGNVWQWTNSQYRSYPYNVNDGRESTTDTMALRVLRGGSWSDNINDLRSAHRLNYAPNFEGSSYIGFRCARS